jgi:Trypsin-like peptidase domain
MRLSPADREKDPKRAAFEVIGTGFLIGPDHVMTANHVIDDLLERAKRHRIPQEQMGLEFVCSTGPRQWQTIYCPLRVQVRSPETDTASVVFDNRQTGYLKVVDVIGRGWRPRVGMPVGTVGYPFGSILLRSGRTLRRFGPILKQGVIAAMSPYDEPEPTDYLLDLVSAPASSGSPVFLTESHQVIGMVVKGQVGQHASISVAVTLYDTGGNRIFVRSPRADLSVTRGGVAPAEGRFHEGPRASERDPANGPAQLGP